MSSSSIFIPSGILSQETLLVIRALRASTYLSKTIWFTSMVVNKTRILVAAPEGATYTVLSPASAELTIRSEMQNY